MSRVLRIVHTLSYSFGHERSDTPASFRLCPLDSRRQRLLHHRVVLDPEPTVVLESSDELGNSVTDVLWESVTDLNVVATSVVDLALGGERFAHLDPMPFLGGSPFAPMGSKFAELGCRAFGADNTVSASSLFRFAKLMAATLHYDARASDKQRSAAVALRRGAGAHADYAHLGVAVLRSLGHAACYVQGYLLPASGAGVAKPHAWLAVHSGAGWLEVDPTLGCPADLRHVAVAAGRDALDVPTVAGDSLTCGIYPSQTSLSFYPLGRLAVPDWTEVPALAS